MAGPAHSRDPSQARQVEAMAGYGIPVADIAQVLDMDLRTLRELYAHELDTGQIVANAKVAESLFRKATGDHRQAVTAAIFWLKTRARWREATAEGGGDAVQGRLEPISDLEIARRLLFMQRKLEESGQPGAALLPQGDRQGAHWLAEE